MQVHTLLQFLRQDSIMLKTALMVLALGLLSAHRSVAASNPQDLTLELVPQTLDVPEDGKVQGTLILQNPSSSALEDIRLSWFGNEGIKLEIETVRVNSLPPNGTLAPAFLVSRARPELVPGNLFIRADYKYAGTNGVEIARVVIGTLRLQDQATNSPDKLVEVQMKASLQSLNEKNPGTLYLTIKNKSNQRLAVKITARGPPFLTIETNQLSSGLALSPYENVLLDIPVKATSIVRPGKQLLLFQVDVERTAYDKKQVSTLIIPQEIEVGVFGESILLTLLGVPSFLVLPGFLALVTLGLLWKLVGPKIEFPLKSSTPEFWLVAITLSIFSAVAYPWATEKWGAMRRDYLNGYGLLDVVQVWFGSILLGLCLCLALGFCMWAHKTWRAWKQRQWEFSPNDGPLQFLGKFAKRHRPPNLDRVQVTDPAGATSREAFWVEPVPPEGTDVWVAPKIVVKWRDSKNRPDLQKEVQDQVTSTGSTATLVRLLQTAETAGLLTADWETEGRAWVTGVSKFKRTSITRKGSQQLLVEIS
jgi:hypothetical protein